MKGGSRFLGIAGVLALSLSGVALWLRQRKKSGWDPQFTGAFPRSTGAKSAVTGGHPEDINQMPATEDPQVEGTIYDGSDLSEVAQSVTA